MESPGHILVTDCVGGQISPLLVSMHFDRFQIRSLNDSRHSGKNTENLYCGVSKTKYELDSETRCLLEIANVWENPLFLHLFEVSIVKMFLVNSLLQH